MYLILQFFFNLLPHKDNDIICLQCTYLLLSIITMKEYKPQRPLELEYSFETLREESSFFLDGEFHNPAVKYHS